MGIAKNKVSSRGSSKPSPIYLPVATNVNCPQAGVSAILAKTFLVSFPPPDVELPDHVEEVVGQNPHLEPGLVGLEVLATGLVPPESVLSFLDPVFYLGPAIIDLDHLAGRQPGVGDHQADPGEKLAAIYFTSITVTASQSGPGGDSIYFWVCSR
jgi:hypothetical protein